MPDKKKKKKKCKKKKCSSWKGGKCICHGQQALTKAFSFKDCQSKAKRNC